MFARIVVTGIRFGSGFTSRPSKLCGTETRIMSVTWMISTLSSVHAGATETVISITSTCLSKVSLGAEAFESSDFVDTGGPVHADAVETALINVEGTGWTCPSRRTSTSESVDKVCAGSVVHTWARPTLVQINFTSISSGSRRTCTFESSGLSIENGTVKLRMTTKDS